MAKDQLIRDVCSRCCVWYKPGEKEELSCGGVLAIEALGNDLIPPAELNEQRDFKNCYGELLNELVCRRCAFRVDGCDFRDPKIAERALPCGGYVHLDNVLSKGIITEADLRDALMKRI